MAVKTGNDSANTLTGTNGTDTLNGLGGDDTLFGLLGIDTLLGGLGRDLLDGGGGNDRMLGGAGNDTYVVDGSGDVVVETSTGGIDTVRASIDVTLANNVENLILTGGGDLDGAGNGLGNTITGNGGDNTLAGQGGNDSLVGGGGDDSLIGGEGNDRLEGGAGSDRLVGGAGSDTYVLSSGDVISEAPGAGTDTVLSGATLTLGANLENLTLTGGGAINGTGNGATNVITGNNGANTLSGLGGNDVLFGGGGNDRLIGGDGRDALNGGAGIDRLEGGADNDSYTIDNPADVVIEATNGGTDILAAPFVVADLPDNVEIFQLLGFADLDLVGGAGVDRFIGNAGSNTISGGDGNDRLLGGAGNDLVQGGDDNDVLDGGTGDDSVIGGAGVDTLTGGGDNDRIDGGAGGDRMSGGSGSDIFIVDNVGDLVLEVATPIGGLGRGTALGALVDGAGAGDIDEIRTSTVDINLATIAPNGRIEVVRLQGTGNLDVIGNANDDTPLTIFGNGGNNTLIGQASDDSISGGGGADTLIGGAGNDTLNGGAGGDRLIGGAGNDTYIVADAGDAPIEAANGGEDTIVVTTDVDLNDFANFENVDTAGAGDITITGTTGDNTLIGTTGDNVILGDAGNDVIEGGAGNDSLDGGLGNDVFGYAAGFGLGDDVVTDAGGTDAIRFADGDGIGNIAIDGNDIVLLRFDGSTIRIVDQVTAGTIETIEQLDPEVAFTRSQNLIVGFIDTPGSDILVDGDGGEDFDLDGNDDDQDVVYANGGADVITALGQQQIIVFPGSGDDVITGGSGDSDIIAYVRPEAIVFDFDAGTITIGGETDLFTGIEGFYGSDGDDVFLGTDNSSAFPFFGGAGGDDTLVGGTGFEFVDYLPSLEGVAVDLAAGTGGGGASTGNDTLIDVDDVGGSLFDDSLAGTGGANVIVGNRGDDILRGRLGDDVYVYNFGDGNDTIIDTGGFENLDYANFERFDVTWFRDGNDLVQRSLDGAEIRIVDHYTGDTLDLVGGFYLVLTGPDLNGISAPELIVGTAGNDTIAAAEGEDRVYGGDGDDVIHVEGDGEADWVVPGRGNDAITGSLGSYDAVSYLDAEGPAEFDMGAGTVALDGEVDVVVDIEGFYGTPFDDVFRGTARAGDSFIWEGGAGDDQFLGGASEEEIGYVFAREGVTVDLVTGVVVGGASVGRDTFSAIDDVLGSAFSDTLFGNGGNNILTGGPRDLGDSADFLNGRGGNDVLQGLDGDDRMIGGTGDDSFEGNRGDDSMSGGAGADAFAYGRGANNPDADAAFVGTNITASAAGVIGDTITDFTSGEDTFRFHTSAFNAFGNVPLGALTDGVNFSTIAASYNGIDQGINTEADAARDTWIFSTVDRTLYYDSNGDFDGYHVVATIQAGGTIVASDIEIVA